jgi:Zn-dependent metalloprotease
MKLRGLILGLACLSTSAFAHENGTIKIYDAKFVPQIISMFKPGNLVLEDGQKKTLIMPKTARILNSNLEKVRDFFAEEFERKSWDNKGTDIIASLNINRFTILDVLGSKQNAAWAKTRFIFGAGDDKGLDNFEKALDVVGHEYTHAVVQSTSNLKYEGQSGALNEHLADVFGVIVNYKHNKNLPNPYLIGATVLNGAYAEKAHALRDMMDPSKGLSQQPSHMNDLKSEKFKKFAPGCVSAGDNDNCGVHILSGIPNKMSALVMSAIGIEESAELFYNVMTKRLTENSQFSDYRTALMEECKTQSSDTCGIVDDALKSVGL